MHNNISNISKQEIFYNVIPCKTINRGNISLLSEEITSRCCFVAILLNTNNKNIFMRKPGDRWWLFLSNTINVNIFLPATENNNYTTIFFDDDDSDNLSINIPTGYKYICGILYNYNILYSFRNRFSIRSIGSLSLLSELENKLYSNINKIDISPILSPYILSNNLSYNNIFNDRRASFIQMEIIKYNKITIIFNNKNAGFWLWHGPKNLMPYTEDINNSTYLTDYPINSEEGDEYYQITIIPNNDSYYWIAGCFYNYDVTSSRWIGNNNLNFSIIAEGCEGDIDYLKNKINTLQVVSNPNQLSESINDLQDLITNIRNINLGKLNYTLNTSLEIPSNTKIQGVRGATIIRLGNASTIANFDINSENITFEDITFIGKQMTMNSVDFSSTENIGNKNGISNDYGFIITGAAKNIHFKNCKFCNFGGAAIKIQNSLGSLFNEKEKITDCIFNNNYIGILLDYRSEFNTIIGCSFGYNMIGIFADGGNNIISACQFTKNTIGIICSGLSSNNDTHSTCSGSRFCHHSKYSICCINMNNGYYFTGCEIWEGPILLSNSKLFSYVGGFIAASITIENPRLESMNHIMSTFFGKSYNSGTITGDTLTLSMKNNEYLDGSDASGINNNI